MSKKLIECVPNFSEGRDQTIIDAISKSIRDTPGCTLLDVDPGKSTNRTVYTFVGCPTSIVEGALNAAKTAYQLIDMSKHTGEHPRMGALDVCPFVPIRDVTMEECVNCSKEFGKRLGEELKVPVFLYEEASTQAYRKQLKQIRQGEYEGLEKKLQDPQWAPDFGPASFVSRYGGTVTGARSFLIAYNVNILGTKEQAHRIALNVREAGRSDNEPGRLKFLKGIGWYVDEYNMAQVSMNLDNYLVTPPHIVFEECSKDARELNLAVAGSEIVGLVPLEALLMAADYYIQKENLFILDEALKVRLAIERLGLNSCSPFNPKKRIIDYMVQEDLAVSQPLAALSVKNFIEVLGSRTPAPGGGSAAAVVAAMGAALGAMTGWMTYGKKKFEALDSQMRAIIPPLDKAMKDLIPFIDADTKAFNDYIKAMGVKGAEREAAIDKALKQAINVPLSTMKISNTCWESMVEMAKVGNIASKSDLEVGAKSLETGIWGAHRNVCINLQDLKDVQFKEKTLKEANEILENARINLEKVLNILDNRKD
ncbi:hypothetical protein CYY_002788 [Polysphondylium violaceum]|uniref:Formimidoyltransferase-cyclodeaminase n=1 Tax=Polysphondylium violaceum TaxID=133409 RepID=A0A8J4Q0P1_9MYCE|nr:hypothetical protein CYY_002788 [Polysphondylium violaceum]